MCFWSVGWQVFGFIVHEKGWRLFIKRLSGLKRFKLLLVKKSCRGSWARLIIWGELFVTCPGRLMLLLLYFGWKVGAEFTWGQNSKRLLMRLKITWLRRLFLKHLRVVSHSDFILRLRKVWLELFWLKSPMAKSILLLLKVEDCWTPKQGTHSLKSYVYLFIMLVPSCGIICYQLLVM
jgi:hypothetical protein